VKEITMQQHYQLVKEGKLKKDKQPDSNRSPRCYFRWKNGMIYESKRVVVDKNTTVKEAAEKGDFKIELVPLKDRDTIIIEDITIDLDNELL
tara:strand:+ start:698 stop:973 length:276 start_codon:yes stop_codon:yes gene_type:complete